MRRRAALAALPLAAALFLTGCGRPGTAAMVDGVRITDSQVGVVTSELTTLQATNTPQAALTNLVVAEGFLPTLEATGSGASEQDGIAWLDTVAAQVGAEPWDYSPELVLIARFQVASGKITEAGVAAMQERMETFDPTINPRFGEWDLSAGVTRVGFPWITSSSAVLG